MTEFEKAENGYLYDANYNKEILLAREKCADLCFEFNNTLPSNTPRQEQLIHDILNIEDPFTITSPFYCDYGFHTTIGHHFYSNHNLTILDGAKVTIGNYVFIAPNCVITTAGHAIDAQMRNVGLEIALPITIGNNVWIGANACILPGVTIGDNSIIGAGSVVTKSIPENTIAAGIPCKIIRKITEEDKKKYPIYQKGSLV